MDGKGKWGNFLNEKINQSVFLKRDVSALNKREIEKGDASEIERKEREREKKMREEESERQRERERENE